MHRSRRSKAHARAVGLATIATLISTFVWTPASAEHDVPPEPDGQYCYLEIDKGNFPDDDDLITLVDTAFPNPPGPNEFIRGFTGTVGIEALAMRQSDNQLFGADHDVLGTIDSHTGVFTPVSGDPFGPGTGSQGTQSLDDADGLSFDPTNDELYASIRREPTGEDLLIKVDVTTGHHVNDAFGPGQDYVVVPAQGNLDDVDDITFDAQGNLLAVINEGGVGSALADLNKSNGAVTNVRTIHGHPNADDIESLAWGNEHGTVTLFALNGKAAPGSPDNISRLWELNPADGSVVGGQPRSQVGEGPGITGARDYEGIACALEPPGIRIAIDVLPDRALNSTEEPHTFIVRACEDPNGNDRCDPGEPPLPGEHPVITVDPAEDEVSNTCETGPGTDANGECTVTIARADAGITTVTAELTTVVRGEAATALPHTSVKVWIHMCKCLDFFDPGEDMPLHIKFTIPPGDTDPNTPGVQDGLDNVTVTDDLPPEYIFEGATDIAGDTPTTPAPGSSNGQVVWEYAHLAPGTYEGDIFVTLTPGLADGTKVVNELSITAGGFTGAATTTHTAVVINDASARAYGLRADLLGGGILPATPDIGPTPDSDVTNPGQLISVPNPLPGASGPLVRVLTVEEGDLSDANHAEAFAQSKTVEADINIPGVLRVQSDTVVARASSTASATGASSTAAGSTIENLRINGTQYGDISEPTTIVINSPLSPGTPFIEVHVLERILSGAAAGVDQPELFDPADPNSGRVTRSGIIVNGIHVVVHNLPATPINEASDVQVAHAEAFATFGPAVDCRTGPRLSGDAYMVRLFNVRPDLANAIVGHVKLSPTGGTETEHLADIDLPAPIGTIDVATTRVSGSRTAGRDPALDTGEAHGFAQVAEAHLLANNVNARAVEATADCTLAAGCTGDTVIANLVIGGTNVCNALGLASTCEPAPNTNVSLPAAGVVLRLNEQIPDAEPNGLTVNAVHIFVVGEGNPLGLPVGAEIIISSAHADVRPSVLIEGC